MLDLTKSQDSNIVVKDKPSVTAGGALARIHKRGTVRVAVESNVAGFGYKDSTGKRSGYDVEVARLVARGIFGGTWAEVTEHLEFVDITCAQRMSICEDDAADMVIDTFVVTDERRKTVDFTDPYFGSHQGLIVRNDNLELDIRTARVGAIDGSIGEQIATELGIGAELSVWENCDAMSDAIESGVIDAGVNAVAIAEAQIRSQARPLSRIKPSLRYDPWAIGVRKGNEELQRYLNEILLESSQDGSLVFAARGTYD